MAPLIADPPAAVIRPATALSEAVGVLRAEAVLRGVGAKAEKSVELVSVSVLPPPPLTSAVVVEGAGALLVVTLPVPVSLQDAVAP